MSSREPNTATQAARVSTKLAPALRSTAREWIALAAIALVISVYYSLIQSDRFVTEARFFVREISSDANSRVNIPILGLTRAGDTRDIEAVATFIASPQMLRVLEGKLALHKHFADRNVDYLSRLSADDSQEERLKYFRRRVVVAIEEKSSMLLLSIQAFSPDMSRRIADTIIRESEIFVNDILNQLANEQVRQIERVLKDRVADYTAAKDQMVKLQKTHGVFDPDSYARAVINIPGFAQMDLKLRIAEETYKAILQSLESARLEAGKNLKKLSVVMAPVTAEEAIRPRRWYSIATGLALLLIGYALFAVVRAGIREHRA